MQPFTHPERYERHAGRLSRRLHARIVADAEESGLLTGARVLDVGTGPGGIPRALAAARPDWTIDGIDLEPRMIDHARAQDPGGSVTFAVGDVAALPYPDAAFDLVVSCLSQHHWSDVPGGLRDLRRILRPGGRLWIYDLRWLLFRATATARQIFPAVRSEPVPLTRLPLPLIARLAAQA
jgi:ubiquinone/menaquinone biosynthesis C-methylase UbiE